MVGEISGGDPFRDVHGGEHRPAQRIGEAGRDQQADQRRADCERQHGGMGLGNGCFRLGAKFEAVGGDHLDEIVDGCDGVGPSCATTNVVGISVRPPDCGLRIFRPALDQSRSLLSTFSRAALTLALRTRSRTTLRSSEMLPTSFSNLSDRLARGALAEARAA